MREEIPRHIHRVDHEIAVLDAHVDVRAEDQIPLGDLLQVLSQTDVALDRRDVLLLPGREGVSARGHDREPLLGYPAADEAAHTQDFLARFTHIAADLACRFHTGLVKLRMNLLARLFITLENLGDERREFAGLRMDDLVFLFDPERE